MKYNIIIIFLIFSSITSCQTKFDKKIWKENSDFMDVKNPRAYMVKDLMKNHINIGMKKNKVIELLGKPYSDTIELYIPKGIKPPDSLRMNIILKKKVDEREKYISYINNWYRDNYKSAPILKYPVGWSLSDPKFLVIRLNNEKRLVNFEVIEY